MTAAAAPSPPPPNDATAAAPPPSLLSLPPAGNVRAERTMPTTDGRRRLGDRRDMHGIPNGETRAAPAHSPGAAALSAQDDAD